MQTVRSLYTIYTNKDTQLRSFTPLTEKEIPALLEEQLQHFTLSSIHAHRLVKFNAQDAVSTLLSLEGQQVIGADFGGDKGVVRLFTVANGQLEIDNTFEQYVQSSHGDGYLEILEATANYATPRGIPVGVSWGAPLEGTKTSLSPQSKKLSRSTWGKVPWRFQQPTSHTTLMHQ